MKVEQVLGGGKARWRTTTLVSTLLHGGLVLSPTIACAELVVLSGGDVLKVASYELEGETLRVHLASGGSLGLPLSRVERVLNDEIVAAVDVELETQEVTAGSALSLEFDESQPVPDTPYGTLIHAAARQHGINPRLLAAMARAESNFDPQALSHKGARGLLQLMPATAKRFGVDPAELYDAARNLEAGARYVHWLSRHFDGDLTKILAAYNAGEGMVKRYQGVPPFRETRAYVKRIYAELGLELGW